MVWFGRFETGLSGLSGLSGILNTLKQELNKKMPGFIQIRCMDSNDLAGC